LSWKVVHDFESLICNWFGAKYGVAVDSCTHGVELCLRLKGVKKISIPKRTYLSIPFLSHKLGLPLEWRDESWEDYYEISNSGIYDAAVLWKEMSYIPNSMMCLSFQFQKHLSLGRGGMILLDDEDSAKQLSKMVYDGRTPNVPWRDQNIDTIGYHYYMTPETAQMGVKKFQDAIHTEPKKWVLEDWPDLTQMEIFK
jgi:dTDP-4-amino-4,6-dideoxygalactose transaminase